MPLAFVNIQVINNFFRHFWMFYPLFPFNLFPWVLLQSSEQKAGRLRLCKVPSTLGGVNSLCDPACLPSKDQWSETFIFFSRYLNTTALKLIYTYCIVRKKLWSFAYWLFSASQQNLAFTSSLQVSRFEFNVVIVSDSNVLFSSLLVLQVIFIQNLAFSLNSLPSWICIWCSALHLSQLWSGNWARWLPKEI